MSEYTSGLSSKEKLEGFDRLIDFITRSDYFGEVSRSYLADDISCVINFHGETGEPLIVPYEISSWEPMGSIDKSEPVGEMLRRNFDDVLEMYDDFERAERYKESIEEALSCMDRELEELKRMTEAFEGK